MLLTYKRTRINNTTHLLASGVENKCKVSLEKKLTFIFSRSLFSLKSCFMYMIDYYLLEAVVSFCDHTKTAASFSEVLMCSFRL